MSGDLFVVSGPSGVGKGTLLAQVLPQLEHVWLSVSATTRLPRTGEREGVHYFFLSHEEFDNLISVDGLLEWASVHGERYGTIRAEVDGRLAQGIDVVLEIDPQGALQVLARNPAAILIFVQATSLKVLEQRLRDRGTESDAAIKKRMADVRVFMRQQKQYRYVIVNDNLQRAAGELLDIFIKQRNPHVTHATPSQRTARKSK